MIRKRDGGMDDLTSKQSPMEVTVEADRCDSTRAEMIADAITDAVKNAAPPAQPDIEKICARIKAEAIKRNVEYMKHGDRYMLGFVDGMRLARRIVDGTIDDPVYFTTSGEKQNENTSRQHQKGDPTQRHDAEGSC